MRSKIDSNIFKIGVYQIIGGLIGILLVLYSFIESSHPTGIPFIVYLLMLTFFCYSLFCGFLCIKSKKNSLQHSLINQFLQLISFSVAGYAFSYATGIFISIGLDLTDSVLFIFGFDISKFEFNFNRDHGSVTISINLVALLLIYYIDKLRVQKKLLDSLEISNPT